jgi:hypothetical protein
MTSSVRSAGLILCAISLGAALAAIPLGLRSSQCARAHKECEHKLTYYRLYSNIEIGMLDYDVERMFGRKPTVMEGPEWPTKLGEIPGYQHGCPASLLFPHGDASFVYKPNNAICWLRWDLEGGYWIAVACLGEASRRYSSAVQIVAKRRSHD